MSPTLAAPPKPQAGCGRRHVDDLCYHVHAHTNLCTRTATNQWNLPTYFSKELHTLALRFMYAVSRRHHQAHPRRHPQWRPSRCGRRHVDDRCGSPSHCNARVIDMSPTLDAAPSHRSAAANSMLMLTCVRGLTFIVGNRQGSSFHGSKSIAWRIQSTS